MRTYFVGFQDLYFADFDFNFGEVFLIHFSISIFVIAIKMSSAPNYCTNKECSKRIWSNDPHKLCISCRGHDCVSDRCVECASWSDDIYIKYIGTISRRKRDALAKRTKRALSSSIVKSSSRPIRELSSSEEDFVGCSDELSADSQIESAGKSSVGNSDSLALSKSPVDLVKSVNLGKAVIVQDNVSFKVNVTSLVTGKGHVKSSDNSEDISIKSVKGNIKESVNVSSCAPDRVDSSVVPGPSKVNSPLALPSDGNNDKEAAALRELTSDERAFLDLFSNTLGNMQGQLMAELQACNPSNLGVIQRPMGPPISPSIAKLKKDVSKSLSRLPCMSPAFLSRLALSLPRPPAINTPRCDIRTPVATSSRHSQFSQNSLSKNLRSQFVTPVPFSVHSHAGTPVAEIVKVNTLPTTEVEIADVNIASCTPCNISKVIGKTTSPLAECSFPPPSIPVSLGALHGFATVAPTPTITSTSSSFAPTFLCPPPLVFNLYPQLLLPLPIFLFRFRLSVLRFRRRLFKPLSILEFLPRLSLSLGFPISTPVISKGSWWTFSPLRIALYYRRLQFLMSLQPLLH